MPHPPKETREELARGSSGRWRHPSSLIGTLRQPALALAVLLCCGVAVGRIAAAEAVPARQPVVEQLIRLLDARPDLRADLVEGLRRADLAGLATPDDFFAFCDAFVTWVPIEREL